MARRRKTFGKTEMTKVAIAALKEQKTARQLAVQFGVHSAQVRLWKRQLIDGAPELFERGKASSREVEVRGCNASKASLIFFRCSQQFGYLRYRGCHR